MDKPCTTKETALFLMLLVFIITNVEKSSAIEEYTNSSILFSKTSEESGKDGIINSSSESARAHLFNRKTRRHFLRLFRRKIRIPEKSSLSLNAQVSRPNIFPRIFNQEEGIIFDAVLEWPSWLDLDDFAEDMYGQTQNHDDNHPAPKASNLVGIERCFLYEKLEWLLGFMAQLPEENAHACILKFICETQTIHSFYPELPTSVAFELVHLMFTPSFGGDDSCVEEYIIAENTGRTYGKCEPYDSSCPYSVSAILIRNFFHLPEMIMPEDEGESSGDYKGDSYDSQAM